jgi:thiol-disulfide isomerase/thioredoxin
MGILNSCIITEFESVPNSSFSNESSSRAPSSQANFSQVYLSSSDGQVFLSEYLEQNCELKPVPDLEHSYHGIAEASSRENTEGMELADWNDSLTVLLYFKSTCPHCYTTMQEMMDFAADYIEENPEASVHFLALATQSSDEGSLSQYLQSTGTPFPVYKDEAGEFSDPYGTGFVPVLYVFDPQGRAWHIFNNEERWEVIRGLLRLLDEG